MRLVVEDDGPGIPDGELPRVFDRYFRGSRARANGSGIGLAVVAALVQAHGGTVEAADAPEGGAIISVSLPKDSGVAGAPAVPRGHRSQTAADVHTGATATRA